MNFKFIVSALCVTALTLTGCLKTDEEKCKEDLDLSACGRFVRDHPGKALGDFLGAIGNASKNSPSNNEVIFDEPSYESSAPAKKKAHSSYKPGDESFKDSRDGKNYNVVSIGGQYWMASNLNYQIGDSYCYNDDYSNCTKYGRLYTWNAAMRACPDGWELPSNADFNKLKTYLDKKYGSAGVQLKSTSFTGMDGTLNGFDSEGFNALPAGDRVGTKYTFLGENAYFWTSDSEDDTRAYDWVLTAKTDEFAQGNIKYALKKYAMSVRCIYK